MSQPDPQPPHTRSFAPRHPALVAVLVFVLAAATLCWPMLLGRYLLGDDQYVAGYAFRLFAAEAFKETGQIPLWNPYLFGGLPYVAAMHGDIFYPTAWLRWILPIDTAMNLGLALHLVLAGCTMYALLRWLRVGWAGAVIGGLAYELTGIVASLVRPGHDGKLFVSALAPLLFLALLVAIRHRRPWGWGLLALTVGLCILSPHYQLTYYLLVAGGLWTLWLVFRDPERPADLRWPVPLALGLLAVGLGLAIAAIQALPFLSYIPFSPRGAGGPSAGWEYATNFSMPVEELVTTVLPQFNGVLEQYWGRNFFKLHTEYLGAIVVLLAAWGWRARREPHGRVLWAFGGIALLFLLVSFGRHTPFYRLWYEVMPMMKKVRAPGMAFYLVALPVAVSAGFGAERLLAGGVSRRALSIGIGILGGIALLGVVGGLQPVAEAIAPPQQLPQVMANAPALRTGALRLLLVVLVGGGVLWAAQTGRIRGALAAGLLGLVVVGDLWSLDRRFFDYRAPAAQLYADDPVTARLRQEPLPYRLLDAGVYPQSYLMAFEVPQVLGYHGNEVRYYDELLGGKNQWTNLGSPNLHDLLAVRFLLLPEPQAIPGYRQVLGPVATTPGRTALLYERDTAPPYVRVVPAAAKVPEEQIVPTVIDPRFPYDAVVLYPDTASVSPAPIGNETPAPSPVSARLEDWRPGHMRIALDGAAETPAYLLVSETWYPNWQATVDGQPAAVHRADHALISVVIPPGARRVELDFSSAAYRTGKMITLLALLGTGALLAAPVWLRRGTRA